MDPKYVVLTKHNNKYRYSIRHSNIDYNENLIHNDFYGMNDFKCHENLRTTWKDIVFDYGNGVKNKFYTDTNILEDE